MASRHLTLLAVSFAYPSSSRFLFEDLSLQLDSGWAANTPVRGQMSCQTQHSRVHPMV